MHQKYTSSEIYPARVSVNISELNLNLQLLFTVIMSMQALVHQRATSAQVPQRQHLNFAVHSRLFTLISCAKLMAIRARQHSIHRKGHFLLRLSHANRPRRPARSVFKNVFKAFQNCLLPPCNCKCTVTNKNTISL